MIITHFQTSIKQLLANKGKAALTMLGVIIGIGSVIYIMTLGEAAKNFLLGQISQFGTNVIEIGVASDFGPFGGSDAYSLTDDDIEALEDSSLLPEITGISGGYTVTKTAEYSGETYTVSLYGDRAQFFDINNLNLLNGRFFSESDVHSQSRVLVIGNQFADDTFGSGADAVGKILKVDGNSLKIIGVVEDPPSGGGFIPQTIVYAPVSTVRSLFAPADELKNITFMLVEFEQGADAEGFQERLTYELNRIKNVPEEDGDVFLVISRKQFIEIFDTVLLGIQLFVSAIAGISLVVGGIGIMNIMLVTVRERTKEIGLRKAVGAKNSSILIQFLIEAVVITTVGGILGIGLGLGLSGASVALVNFVQPDWNIEFAFVPSSIALACGVSITTGIIFGLYPALKASRLHPIESLRYE